MVDFKKYLFRKYSADYPRLFNKEKSRLKKIFPKAKIGHMGSSSVRGLGGKGIIDIVLSVPKKKIKRAIKKLQKNSYDYKPLAGDKERRFFQKIIRYAKKERRIHIHLTHDNSHAWKSALAVKGYLNKHKNVAKKYEQIKKKAVRYAKGEGKMYRDYKKSFLKKIERKAIKEYSKFSMPPTTNNKKEACCCETNQQTPILFSQHLKQEI